jgi:hypothetical protein
MLDPMLSRLGPREERRRTIDGRRKGAPEPTPDKVDAGENDGKGTDAALMPLQVLSCAFKAPPTVLQFVLLRAEENDATGEMDRGVDVPEAGPDGAREIMDAAGEGKRMAYGEARG